MKSTPVSAYVRAFDRKAFLELTAAVDGFADVFNGHVVEEQSFGAVGESFVDLFERADFDFDGLGAATVAMGKIERGNDAAGERDVIVLDEDAVGEIEPVILAATAADAVFVEHAETGHGLAGVEDARLRAVDSFDEFASGGGDAAHALEKIQDHALTGEDDTGVVTDDGDRLAFAQVHAIENLRMAGDFVMRDH